MIRRTKLLFDLQDEYACDSGPGMLENIVTTNSLV